MTKLKILVLGPTGAGKTGISNYLADATSTGSLPYELRPTQGVRILEFDVKGIKTLKNSNDIEVQLWDCSGDERYANCWPAIRRNANGILFVYSTSDVSHIRKLELFYNYFVAQNNFSPKQCLVLSNNTENEESDTQNIKLPSMFSKMSSASVNIETSGEKLRFDFNQFLSSIASGMQK